MPELPTGRGGLAATTLAGRCYVFGGEHLGKAPPNTFRENEGFDFAARTWQTYAPLPPPAMAWPPSLWATRSTGCSAGRRRL